MHEMLMILLNSAVLGILGVWVVWVVCGSKQTGPAGEVSLHTS